MKIRKYYTGGISYLPTTNTGGPESYGSPVNSTSSTKSKSDFMDDVVDMVTENGIDIDVHQFLKYVSMQLKTTRDPFGEKITTQSLIKIQDFANRVKNNKSAYDIAVKSLEEEDAWSEIATDKSGRLYVQDSETGEIKTISGSEYQKDSETYIPLTNQDLLNLRRARPDLSFNTSILDNLASAVGMKTITDALTAQIEKFGKTSITGYSEKQTNKIQTGLNTIVSGEIGNISNLLVGGPDGVYKISQESTVADTGIKEAMNYLYNSMPKAYKNVLVAKAAVEGYSPEALLLQMMYYNTDRKIAAEYDSATSKLKGYYNGNDPATLKEAYTEDNLAIRTAMGDLPQTNFFLSPIARRVGDKAMMLVTAWNAGVPQTMDKKAMSDPISVKDLLANAAQFKGADIHSVTFGDRLLTDEEVKTLIYTQDSNVTRVALPATTVNGHIVPDLELIKKVNELNNDPEFKHLTTIEQNQKLQELQSDAVYFDQQTKTFKFKPNAMMMFLSVNAYGSSKLLNTSISEENGWLRHLPRREGQNLKTTFNNLIQYGKLDVDKNDEKVTSFGKGKGGSFYEGNIYVPIVESTMAFQMTADQYVPKTQYMEVEEQNRLGEMIQQAREASQWTTSFNN